MKTQFTYKELFLAAHQLQWPVAVWRLPQQTAVEALISFETATTLLDETDIESLPSGFMVSAFNTELPKYYLRADAYWHSTEAQLQIAPRVSGAQIMRLYEQLALRDQTALLPPLAPFYEYTQADYQMVVNEAVAQMQAERFQKVVLSRAKAVDLPPNFDLCQAFAHLCELYPTAFVSLVSLPEAGVWMGASPEVLVQIDENTFKTVALAGTQPYNPDLKLSHVMWRQKEIEEQAMVSRYIINCFKKIRLREYEEIGPRTAVAGHLVHLRTDFVVDRQTVDFPELASLMVDLLHPTSAVCGLPKSAALHFLRQHERYDRRLYSGFLGPVNIAQSTRLFVNLRCMELTQNKAILYAGGGLTADSEADREWTETELKMGVMKKVLQP